MLSELNKLMLNAFSWKDWKVAKGDSLPAFSTETQIFHILVTGIRAGNWYETIFKITAGLCWKILF